MDRDLSSHDVWEQSLARSRERRARAAAAPKSSFDLPTRGLSVAALVAVTGGTVATVGVAAVGGDDGTDQGGPGAAARQSAVVEAPERVAKTVGAADAPAPATSRAAADQVSSTADADGTSLRARIAESLGEDERASSRVDGSGATVAAAAASAPGTTEDAAAEGDSSGSAGDGASEGTPSTGDGSEQGSADSGSTGGETPGAGDPSDDGSSDGASPGGDAEESGRAQPGGGVGELQQALGVPVDGDFGPQTTRALKRWQHGHGLTADGVAGPQTREALGIGEGKVLKPERAQHGGRQGGSRHNSTAGGGQRAGGGVRALQQALGIGVDGVFGPGTERALQQWQRSHGLTADGVAGPQTRQALGLGAGKVLKRHGGGDGGSSRGGGNSSIVSRVIAAGNAIATTPYVYGGGHGSFQSSGYDCSGSVSYALHGGGLLSTPLDSTGLMSYGEPGPGKRITIYANSGHAYMVVDGRRYDTSARSETGSRWTSTQRSPSGYVVRHPRGL